MQMDYSESTQNIYNCILANFRCTVYVLVGILQGKDALRSRGPGTAITSGTRTSIASTFVRIRFASTCTKAYWVTPVIHSKIFSESLSLFADDSTYQSIIVF